MQGDYVSCFPALTPGGWLADGSNLNSAANRRQQQRQQELSEQQQATPNILVSLGLGSAAGWQQQQQQQALFEQQQATPSNIFISTQFGGGDGGVYSVLQHLHMLLDSQQRSRGSGNALGTGDSPDSNHQPPQHAGTDAAADRQQPQQAQQLGQAAAKGSEQGSAGGEDGEQQRQQQQDESPTSPDELLQPGQQGLGCLLTTPYPLLYRTTNAAGVPPEEQQEAGNVQLQQQQAHAPDSKGSNTTSGAAAAAEGGTGHAGHHGSISGCGYQSVAAAIEDAAQPCAGQVQQAGATSPGTAVASGGGVDAGVAAGLQQCADGAAAPAGAGVGPAGKNLSGSSPSSSEPAWTPTVSADARHHS
jgi:hypothetical protein